MSTLSVLKLSLAKLSVLEFLVKLAKTKFLRSVCGVAAVLIVRYYIIKWYRKYKNYPPGPIGLPIIGSLLLMNALKKFTCELPFKYGKIMYTTIGNRHFTLINDSKVFKQIAKTKEFVNRPIGLGKATQSTPGFAFLNDNKPHFWNERRLDIKQSLVNTVSRTDYMENNILKVLNGSVYSILNDCVKNNKLFYSENLFRNIALNNLLFTSFGYTLDFNDPLCNKFIRLSDKWFPRLLVGFLPFYLGFLKYFLKSYISETIKLEHKLGEIIKEMINKMEKSKSQNAFVSNILSKNNKTYNKLSLDSKIADIMDIFSAATDTTSSVLTTAFILLAMNLDIQNEVRNELNNNFTLKKVKECPKFEALTYECLRLSNVAYMGGPHAIFKDMKVKVDDKEYIIPKNSVVVENLTFIHDMSPYENWIAIKRKNRSDFNHKLNLDNFLEKENKTNKLKFKMNDSFIYFGFGRRDCIGRQLAIKQLQFILANLLLNYEFQLPKNRKNLSQLKFTVGFVNRVETIGLVVKNVTNS